ncbi:hypothetical protein LWI29_037616 [Acer saccharum]|uniref:Uncharacterized protein n=1 Tax=Acer saccharum TaxID=4024 RepID=A0AA39W3V2_ACESA|nr:hypothetical protein LWI29_037616 [Acer saccharum]
MIGRRGGRGGRGSHQPPNQHDSPNRERDLRDIEVDDLRRQVQQLQQRLEHFEPLEHDVSRHDSENEPTDEENTNPFGRGYDRASNDGNNRRHRHMNNFIRPNFDVKMVFFSREFVCVFLNVPYEKLLSRKPMVVDLVVILVETRPFFSLKNIFTGLRW